MLHPFEVFHQFLPSWPFPASASVVHNVGPDPVHPMAIPSHVSAKERQHVNSEEVCGQFAQSLALSSSNRPPETLVPSAVTSVFCSVLICASAVRKWDTEQYQFTKRKKRAVTCVLIWRGSICFHSKSRIQATCVTYQPRPQARVCQKLGSCSLLKIQTHHFDLLLERSYSTHVLQDSLDCHVPVFA